MFTERDKTYKPPAITNVIGTTTANKKTLRINHEIEEIKPLDMRSAHYIYNCHSKSKKGLTGFSYIFGIMLKNMPKFYRGSEEDGTEIKITSLWQTVLRKYFMPEVRKAYHYFITLGIAPWSVEIIEMGGYKFPIAHVESISKAQIYCVHQKANKKNKQYIYQHIEERTNIINTVDEFPYDVRVLFMIGNDIDFDVGDNVYDVVCGGLPVEILIHPYTSKWGNILSDKVRMDRHENLQLAMEEEKTKSMTLLEDVMKYDRPSVEAMMDYHKVISKGTDLVYMNSANFKLVHVNPHDTSATLGNDVSNPNLAISLSSTQAPFEMPSTRGDDRRYDEEEITEGYHAMRLQSGIYKGEIVKCGKNEFAELPPSKKPVLVPKSESKDIKFEVSEYNKNVSEIYAMMSTSDIGSTKIAAESIQLQQANMDLCLDDREQEIQSIFEEFLNVILIPREKQTTKKTKGAKKIKREPKKQWENIDDSSLMDRDVADDNNKEESNMLESSEEKEFTNVCVILQRKRSRNLTEVKELCESGLMDINRGREITATQYDIPAEEQKEFLNDVQRDHEVQMGKMQEKIQVTQQALTMAQIAQKQNENNDKKEEETKKRKNNEPTKTAKKKKK